MEAGSTEHHAAVRELEEELNKNLRSRRDLERDLRKGSELESLIRSSKGSLKDEERALYARYRELVSP